MAVSYQAISDALKDLLKANVSGFKNVYSEAMDRDLVLDNFPCANVRLDEAKWEDRTIPNGYYVRIAFEVDICAYDFTSFKEAATIRDSLLDSAMVVVQENSRFHNDLNASRLGSVKFGHLTAEGAGGHVAVATFGVLAEVYVEAT